MDSGADATGEAFDGMPLKKPRLDAGDELPPPASLWADIHPDILGVVLRFLPCSADRARVRSVCRRWRAAARSQTRLPPPLPLLVLPEFRLSCLTSDIELTAPRRLLMPGEVAVDDAHYVGSYDEWAVGVAPIKVCSESGGRDYFTNLGRECFLVNAFSQRVVRLPRLCRTSYICGHFSCKILPVINGSGGVDFKINGSYTISPHKVSGMTSWHICTGGRIGDGPNLLPSTRCVTEPLPPLPMEENGSLNCNMVVWRGNLLLVLRYYDSSFDDRKIEVEVFAVDFNTNPYGLPRIHNFDGDCIFIGSGSSKPFPAGLHDGVEGDLIYFVPEYWSPNDRFVYNMRDGTMRPFSAKLFPLEGCVDDNSPVWLFPSE
ncbi:unnamed protein product [Urochloa decumbens]|uniref:DUF295 domain-containing protein n=1 Tax=Urochloa decumbens TaxID=240449 RepID=A0ABC9AKU8_9POAL